MRFLSELVTFSFLNNYARNSGILILILIFLPLFTFILRIKQDASIPFTFYIAFVKIVDLQCAFEFLAEFRINSNTDCKFKQQFISLINKPKPFRNKHVDEKMIWKASGLPFHFRTM